MALFHSLFHADAFLCCFMHYAEEAVKFSYCAHILYTSLFLSSILHVFLPPIPHHIIQLHSEHLSYSRPTLKLVKQFKCL